MTRGRAFALAAGVGGLVVGMVSAAQGPGSRGVRLARDLTSCGLELDAPTALDGLSLAEIAEYRLAKVRQHRSLGVFPEGYHPLRGDSHRIYGPISPGKKWLGPTPYYVANPYVLIVAVAPRHVTPLDLLCPGAEITYRARRIEERHAGAAARCWMNRVFDPSYSDPPGSVRLVMVNSYDAGLRYARVDRSLSTNVEPGSSPTSVVSGLYSQPSLYHLGRLGANNISPEDPNGWLRLASRDAASRIHVKLWREKPASRLTPADFVYEITVLAR